MQKLRYIGAEVCLKTRIQCIALRDLKKKMKRIMTEQSSWHQQRCPGPCVEK